MLLNDDQRMVLAALSEAGDGFCFPFAPISERTELDRKRVRRACRALARKGLAEFQRGLWTDDGEAAGSGYGITRQGDEIVEPYRAIGSALLVWGFHLKFPDLSVAA